MLKLFQVFTFQGARAHVIGDLLGFLLKLPFILRGRSRGIGFGDKDTPQLYFHILAAVLVVVGLNFLRGRVAAFLLDAALIHVLQSAHAHHAHYLLELWIVGDTGFFGGLGESHESD